MTRDKDRKRIIRTRMKKTGESYTAARAHVLSRTPPRAPTQAAVDHAALAGMANEKVAAKTGRTWSEWVRALDADGAAAMPHSAIAKLVHGKHRVGDWWAQTVTVGYERIKGLRERGQRRSGEYEASKSKTIGVPVTGLFEACANERIRRRWIEGLEPVVRRATPPKAIRLQWPDGTAVVLGFYAKGAAKSSIAVQHLKLPTKAAAERAKTFWTERLDALASLLTADSSV